jgi:hypothetical protein
VQSEPDLHHQSRDAVAQNRDPARHVLARAAVEQDVELQSVDRQQPAEELAFAPPLGDFVDGAVFVVLVLQGFGLGGVVCSLGGAEVGA